MICCYFQIKQHFLQLLVCIWSIVLIYSKPVQDWCAPFRIFGRRFCSRRFNAIHAACSQQEATALLPVCCIYSHFWPLRLAQSRSKQVGATHITAAPFVAAGCRWWFCFSSWILLLLLQRLRISECAVISAFEVWSVPKISNPGSSTGWNLRQNSWQNAWCPALE